MRGFVVSIAALLVALPGCDTSPTYQSATVWIVDEGRPVRIDIVDTEVMEKLAANFPEMHEAPEISAFPELDADAGITFIGSDGSEVKVVLFRELNLWRRNDSDRGHSLPAGIWEELATIVSERRHKKPMYSKAVVSGVWPHDYQFTLTGSDAQALADRFPWMEEQDKISEVEPPSPKTNGTVVFTGLSAEITVHYNQWQWSRDGNFPRDWKDGDWAYIEKLIDEYTDR
jgi:hypothetical protein